MKVLLVEDEPEIRSLLKSALEAEYFAVDVAIDGEQGLQFARTNEYDIIILDNIMPKKDGETVCKEIRLSGKTTPILSLSVRAETSTKINLLNAGADDYLTKPFAFEELLARVRALLRRQPEFHSDILTIDDIVLDAGSQTLRRGKKFIHLTRKEFMLLEYLMRNEGIVVSRSMIMEHVWDMTLDPFSNTIEAHILSLRKKLESPHKKKLIHTIAGRGYKIASMQL